MSTVNSNCTGPIGNPDIVGIGVLVSFGIEGLLATIGSLGTVGLRMIYSWNSELPLLSNSYPTAGKQYIAFKSFLPVFIDSAMFFSLSIQIAGLVYVLTRLQQYREAAMSLYAGVFSLFPIYLALFVVWTDLRRPAYRLGMLLLITLTCAALSIVVMVKFFHGDDTLNKNECYREEWKNKLFLVLSCSVFWIISFAAYGLIYILTVPRETWRLLGLFTNRFANKMSEAAPLSLILVSLGPAFSSVIKIAESKDPATTVRLLGILITFCGTWTEFTLLVLSRQYKTVQNDGNQENIIGYGQVLALLIWAPVVAEYIYVAYFGYERGLKGRLPEPYIARTPVVHQECCCIREDLSEDRKTFSSGLDL